MNNDDVIRIAQEEGVPPNVALAILKQENSKDSDVSSAGAVGTAQILPTTFNSLMPDGDINNPKDNVRAGIKYIKQGLDKHGGDPAAAAAYYYGGPNWQNKVAQNPGKKYGGSGPDDGISIEQYSQNVAKNSSDFKSTMDLDAFTRSSFPDSSDVSVSRTPKSGTTISDLNDAADAQLGKIQQSSTDLSARIQQNIKDQAAATRKSGDLAATVKLDEFNQASLKAGENAAELSRLGINTSDLNSTIAQTSVQMEQEYLQTQQMRDSIMAKKNTGMLDDPMQYIINQFTLPSEIRAHNQIVEKIASQKHYIDQATSTAQTVAQVNAAKFTPVSLAGAQASADLLRSNAEEKALALEDKLSTLDYDKQVKTLTVINARINNKENQQKAEDMAGVRQDARAKADAEKQRIQDDNDSIQAAASVLGMKVPDRQTLNKMPKDAQKAITYIAANDGGVGEDPLEAWQVLARGDYRKMPPAVAYQRNVLDTAKQQAEQVVRANPTMATANHKMLQEAVSKEMSRILNQAAADPNHSLRPVANGVIDNPYHIPPPDVMNRLPEVAPLPISKVIDVYRKQFPDKPVTDNMVLELAYANVGTRYVDIASAAKDVSTYYREGVKYNNATMKFDNFGLPLQTNYVADKTDYTDTSKVLKYFLDKKRMEGYEGFKNIPFLGS